MQLYEILELIDHDTMVVVRQDKICELKTVWTHLGKYGGDENIHCSEIELNGYTDLNGISYPVLHVYDIRDVQQSDDELPFPI